MGPDLGQFYEVFTRAAEDLIDRRALQRRADSKFVVPHSLLPALVAALAGDYASLAAPDAYRTLYYDTPDLRLFQDHRRGRGVRHKVRLRAHPERATCYLEIKTRRSEMQTLKLRLYRASSEPMLSEADQEFIRARTGLSRNVIPQIRSEYRRLTLIGLQANERVTIDQDLLFATENPQGLRDPVRTLAGAVIVEVKQWPFSRHSPVMLALRTLGIRASWASKYCIGILSTHNELRHNRLLAGMRALEGYLR